MGLRRDFQSKMIDGLLVGMILYLITRLLVLLAIPFRHLLDNRSGELLFAIGMLALCIYCLERAISSRSSESNRAWYGAVGGVIGWTVINLSNGMGAVNLVSIAGVVTFIMVGLIVSVFWRSKYFPVGAQFFSATLILNWFGSLFVLSQKFLFERFTISGIWATITGIFFVVVGFIFLTFLFVRSDRRIQRIWLGVFLWFCALMAFSSFQGWLV